jgi:ubiquinone/menaquinone biosynthesis C-methylase UbiE
MAFYRDRVYPKLVSKWGDPPPIRDRRRELLAQAEGTVLEIGVGPGVNFAHYVPAKVRKIYALEPNPGMVRLAEQKLQRTPLDVEFLGLPGERIPLPDSSIDTVVSTFTLCTIPGVMDALGGIARVLRPEGRLIFYEISVSPEAHVRRWQSWWEPVHRWVFAGLYLTRDIPSLLERAGFRVLQAETGYVTPLLKAWSHCCWGTAAVRSRPDLPSLPRTAARV